MKKSSLLLLILSLTVFGCVEVTTSSVGGGDIELNSASDFTIMDLEENKVSLEELSVGKPIVVNLWGTWCVPCVKELPHFMEVAEAYKGDVNFYYLSDESTDKIKKFIKKKGYNQERFFQLQNSLSEINITVMPTTFFINEKGEVVEVKSKSLEKAELEKFIQDNMIK